jgi:predicted branched-subunit amino acid permease
MTDHSTDSGATPRWTLDGFRIGVIAMLPLVPGLIAFGVAYGVVAAQKGFTLIDAVLMSVTVFSGTAQMVALEVWPDRLTVATILTLGLVTGTVGLRFLLIGASLRPWLGTLPSAKIYPTLFLLTDTSWLLAMRYRQQGGNDAAMLLGCSVASWVVWVVSCIPGFVLGSMIGDAHRFGLDLVVPVFFAAMLVPLWHGARRALAWSIAGAIALAADQLVGGWWFVLAGALAGSVAGGFIDDRE